MNQVDKISKALLDLVNYSGDVIDTNITKANSGDQFGEKLSEEQLIQVLNVVKASVNQAFQKGMPAFQKNVKAILADSQKDSESKKKK